MSKATGWTAIGIVFFIAVVAIVFRIGAAIAPFSSRADLGTQSPASGWTSETILRKKAVKTVLPEFPVSATREHRSGVAVAMVYLDVRGHVSKVEVLRSPAPAIADSMSVALSQWIFEPFTTPDGQTLLISGKITFYFEIEHNKGVVLDPASVGYVGRWPPDLQTLKKPKPGPVSQGIAPATWSFG